MLFFVVRSHICKIIIGLEKQFIYFFDKEIQKQSFAKSDYHNRQCDEQHYHYYSSPEYRVGHLIEQIEKHHRKIGDSDGSHYRRQDDAYNESHQLGDFL